MELEFSLASNTKSFIIGNIMNVPYNCGKYHKGLSKPSSKNINVGK